MKKQRHLPLPGGGGLRGRGIVFLLLLAAASLSATPVLVEAYQEGTITIPGDKMDTVTVVELAFSVDTACYVQFTAGGLAQFLTMMLLEFDANYLLPVAIVQGNRSLSDLIVYTYLITPGSTPFVLEGLESGATRLLFARPISRRLSFCLMHLARLPSRRLMMPTR